MYRLVRHLFLQLVYMVMVVIHPETETEMITKSVLVYSSESASTFIARDWRFLPENEIIYFHFTT